MPERGFVQLIPTERSSSLVHSYEVTTMQYSFMKYAALIALAVGAVSAQAPANNSQPSAPNRQGHLERMAQSLNLTDSQKEQARTIFQQARQSAQPIRQELRRNREKLTAAVKAGNSEAEIQKLAGEQGRLLGQLVAIRTESSAKFYQILTPEQRIKADQMDEQFKQKVRSRGRGYGL
jgi:Spy/CpxP family protein refolding chaperone